MEGCVTVPQGGAGVAIRLESYVGTCGRGTAQWGNVSVYLSQAAPVLVAVGGLASRAGATPAILVRTDGPTLGTYIVSVRVEGPTPGGTLIFSGSTSCSGLCTYTPAIPIVSVPGTYSVSIVLNGSCQPASRYSPNSSRRQTPRQALFARPGHSS
jgi:hypothetical protein